MGRHKKITIGTETGNPANEHALKIIQENEERKKNTTVTDEYITIQPNPSAKRGGKVLKITRTSTGLKHSTYLGKEKETGMADFLIKEKEKGSLRQFPG